MRVVAVGRAAQVRAAVRPLRRRADAVCRGALGGDSVRGVRHQRHRVAAAAVAVAAVGFAVGAAIGVALPNGARHLERRDARRAQEVGGVEASWRAASNGASMCLPTHMKP